MTIAETKDRLKGLSNVQLLEAFKDLEDKQVVAMHNIVGDSEWQKNITDEFDALGENHPEIIVEAASCVNKLVMIEARARKEFPLAEIVPDNLNETDAPAMTDKERRRVVAARKCSEEKLEAHKELLCILPLSMTYARGKAASGLVLNHGQLSILKHMLGECKHGPGAHVCESDEAPGLLEETGTPKPISQIRNKRLRRRREAQRGRR